MLRYVVALALALAALTACDDADPSRPADTGLHYVAIGDSFTAAPRIPEIVHRQCQRSGRNYPHLVAERLGEDVTLTDVSCGGARTGAVLQSQVQELTGTVQPPQIDAVDENTDLITVGLGANDLDYVVTAVLGCVLVAESDPRGAPCREANEKQVPRKLRAIRSRLVDTVGALANRAPDARILLVGYPRLLSGGGGCPERFPLARGDVAFVRDSFDRLIDTVAAAAEEAGVEYVDVAAASEGHDICSDEPWVNGRRHTKGQGAAYHPTPAEQEAVAALVLETLGAD